MDKINIRHIPSQPLTINHGQKPTIQHVPKTSFLDHLQTAVQQKNKLSVSKHAQMRLDERAITIDSQTWDKMEEKVSEAKSKGVTDSLVLLKEAALIVSAKNNTVITAMNRAEASAHIFTNINGTIILD